MLSICKTCDIIPFESSNLFKRIYIFVIDAEVIFYKEAKFGPPSQKYKLKKVKEDHMVALVKCCCYNTPQKCSSEEQRTAKRTGTMYLKPDVAFWLAQ